jgi:hypothetical protein
VTVVRLVRRRWVALRSASESRGLSGLLVMMRRLATPSGLTSAATGDAAQIGSGRRRMELLGRRRECDALLVAHVAQSRKWHRPNGWRQHDLTDGAMIGPEKLSEPREYLRFGSNVWCHREMHRAHC